MPRTWRSTGVLAWTDGDGPGRPPPAGSRGLWLVAAGTMGVALFSMVMSDTLCPEHRAWIQVLATIGFVAVGVAITGLLRGWASAPWLTLLAASLGMSMGLIDTLHDPVRGGAIATAFGVVALFGLWMAAGATRARLWERNLRPTVVLDGPSTAPEEGPAASVPLVPSDPVAVPGVDSPT